MTPPAAPVRTCAGCGQKRPQAELARFTAKDGELVRDARRRLPGRGVYLCPRLACFERARARRAFARTLRANVSVPTSLNDVTQEG